MGESEWLSSEDPWRMLDHLLRAGVGDRKLRLFACACWRHAQWVLPAADDLAAVDAIEAAGGELGRLPGGILDYRYQGTAWLFHDGAGAARHWVKAASGGVSKSPAPALMAALLRDVFGSPFRPAPVINPAWPAWNGGTVPRLARVIDGERRFEEMPVLGDALEEAGCGDEELLRHCRGQARCPECLGSGPAGRARPRALYLDNRGAWSAPASPACRTCAGAGWLPAGAAHVRGCWVLDSLARTGK